MACAALDNTHPRHVSRRRAIVGAGFGRGRCSRRDRRCCAASGHTCACSRVHARRQRRCLWVGRWRAGRRSGIVGARQAPHGNDSALQARCYCAVVPHRHVCCAAQRRARVRRDTRGLEAVRSQAVLVCRQQRAAIGQEAACSRGIGLRATRVQDGERFQVPEAHNAVLACSG